MPCDACGCVCGAGGETTPTEELESPLLLDDAEAGPGDITAAPDEEIGRIATYIVWGLLVVLWVYLFYSMWKYAIKYTEGDTWFSLCAAIVMALPMTEFFLILAS